MRADLLMVWGWMVRGLNWFVTTMAFRVIRMILLAMVAVKIVMWIIPVGIWWVLPTPISHSLARRSNNVVRVTANYIDDGSLQMEAGSFHSVACTVNVFGDSGKPMAWSDGTPMVVTRGTKVMIVDHDGKEADRKCEGMVPVLIENRDGLYQGDPVWIPTSKLWEISKS